MRLIDADKLKKDIHCSYSDDLGILEEIDKQPTAYDADKVCDELEEYLFHKYCIEGDSKIDEIVKEGGVHETD